MTYRTVLLNYFHQRDRGWMLSLLAVVLLVYLPFLGNPFFFDDLNFFTGKAPDYYARALFHFDLRWLSYASLGWTYALFSDVNTYFFHLGNALLHGANVILLFYLLRRLVGAVMDGQQESAAITWGAWFGALVFACHPVAVYAVGYVIQRSVLMATLFALVMQLAWLRGLLTGQKRWLLLAVAAYFLAVYSKEHSVLMPSVLVAITLLLRARNRASASALWLAGGAFAAIGLLLVLSIKGVFGTAYEVGASSLFEQQGLVASTATLHLLSVLTQAGLFFKYLLLWALPNPAWMSVDMREHFIASLSEWQAWAGALGFILYGVVAFRLLLRPRWMGLIGLALLYPWLQFWVEFTSIRVQEPFVLYRSYLWMPGIMLFFPLLLSKWPGKKALFMLAMAVLLVPLAWNRLWVFADDYRLWDDAAKLLRSEREVWASRIYYNRAHAAAATGKWEQAAADYERAIAGNLKDEAVMHHDLGASYFNLRRYQDAMTQFDKAISINPEYAKAYFDRGMTLKYLRQEEQAMKEMEKSCELKYAMACVIVKLQPPKK
ncbi:MAG: tetratricopeptide repeat protein [Gallionellaceae bacterium]|nr:tetratricopeptide repeat protein [Gallionellaceae bacterium]